MGRPPDTDEGVRAVGREVINRFDADRRLKAQIPELRIGACELELNEFNAVLSQKR